MYAVGSHMYLAKIMINIVHLRVNEIILASYITTEKLHAIANFINSLDEP